MKRSQVVDLIADWTKPEIHCDIYSDNPKAWADNLLHVLETEVGMKPPAYMKHDINQWHGMSGNDPCTDLELATVNEWEPEINEDLIPQKADIDLIFRMIMDTNLSPVDVFNYIKHIKKQTRLKSFT